MSRPIISKKIKRKNIVYNLELWSPAKDDIQGNIKEPTSFRKEFFNDISLSDTWPEATSKYQERFDD